MRTQFSFLPDSNYLENCQTKENPHDRIQQESAYTQTKDGYKPFVPTIRKTSPSQAEEYAAPIRPPPRRK